MEAFEEALENRVQELLTGQYRPYEKRAFGAPITDYELNQLKQLKQTGIVAYFDDDRVSFHPLPEHYEVRYLSLWERQRARSYYLNTTLPQHSLDRIERLLERLDLHDQLQPRLRDDYVVLWGSKGRSFPNFDEAERMRLLLLGREPQTFQNTVVAFVETTKRA